MFRRRPLPPEEIFTPAAPADPEIFEERSDDKLQPVVRSILRQPGRHLVVFGPTGVGKTSLVLQVCLEEELSVLRVQPQIPIGAESAAELLLQTILAKLEHEPTTEREQDITAEVGLVSSGISRTELQRSQPVHGGLVHQAVEALASSETAVLFIDAFELVPDTHRAITVSMLQSLLHELSDLSRERRRVPRVVIAGIGQSGHEVVSFESSVTRRVAAVEVRGMTPKQLARILDRGAKKARVRLEPAARSQLVEAADGFPYYLHLFALHAVLSAIERSRNGRRTKAVVEVEDVVQSLADALADAKLRLARSYLAAVAPTQKRHYRKETLEALAELDRTTAGIEAIRKSFRELFPKSAGQPESGFLVRPLTELVETYGVLVEQREGRQRSRIYGFRDPLMRSYVRLHRRHPHLAGVERDRLFGG